MDQAATDPARDDDRPRGSSTPDDDEQAERLARAARDVVHQPADPRLEKAFGHLGLFPEAEPAPELPGEPGTPSSPPPPPTTRPTAPPPTVTTGSLSSLAPEVDIEGLRAELAILRSASERLDRRLGTVIGLLALLVVVVVILAVVVLVRG